MSNVRKRSWGAVALVALGLYAMTLTADAAHRYVVSSSADIKTASAVGSNKALIYNGTALDWGQPWTSAGYLTSAVTSVTASAPLASSGGSAPNVTETQADGSHDGYLTSADWVAFNGKLTSELDPLSLHTSGGSNTMSQTLLTRLVEPSSGSIYDIGTAGVPYANIWLSGNLNCFQLNPMASAAIAFDAFSPALTINVGSGSPAGVVTAQPGSLYLNSAGGAGTTLYVKESGTGNTGWVGK